MCASANVKLADMSKKMQEDAIAQAQQAMELYSVEKDMAAFLKKTFDKKYSHPWHCVVGKNFGSYVTHEANYFIFFDIGQFSVLLFKTG
ncbi:unnamed protein product [Calicophoron daubneyi]|uniref:Dynein light chain n=1 Tax=Calicophoron daubneyi TaxID=300641 RepID=A0AAV2TNE1_CALDB